MANIPSEIRVTLSGLERLAATISLLEMLRENSRYSYTVYYEKDETNCLSQLCDRYGSDKGEIQATGHPYGWPSHTYADLMDGRFGHCRESVKKVFECGLGTNNPALASSMGVYGKPGASLRVWRDYFPNAVVVPVL
jgi:hypothetical protein